MSGDVCRALNRLSFQFQRAEADLEYMENRLKLDFMTHTGENGSAEVSV